MRGRSTIEGLAAFVSIGAVLALLLAGTPQVAWELENLGWKYVVGSTASRIQDTAKKIGSQTMMKEVN